MTHTEVEITAELVRDLLRDQHPDLADCPLRLGARGWDNQLWRLGDDLAVRLPWATESADALLRKEHTWLPALAPRLPLPRSEEHTSELQSHLNLVCRLLLEKKKRSNRSIETRCERSCWTAS